MSVSRQTIAEILNIPEDEVKCKNCVYIKQWLHAMYTCSFWGSTAYVPSDAFCTFFSRKEDK